MSRFLHVPVDIPRARLTEDHRYVAPDGAVYDSVTTILQHTKPAEDVESLARWRDCIGETVADHILREAGIIGTEAHRLNEEYLCDIEPGECRLISRAHHEKMRPCLDKINRIRGTELPLFSPKLRLAGTADCIAEYDGTPSIIDYKTKRSPQEAGWIRDYFLQTAAYSMMYEELTGEAIGQAIIIVSSERDTLQTFRVGTTDYRDEFLSRLAAYHSGTRRWDSAESSGF